MKKAIVVLGMHRSGTSSIAGTLAKLGVASPKTLMPEHPTDNPKGYWESLPIVQLNDKILEAAQSSWKDWNPLPLLRSESSEAKFQIDALVQTIEAEFGSAPLIVLKDPRICRLFPLWRQALLLAGYEPLIVVPIRHPLEVAASLESRDGLSQSEGELLWLRHVLDAERETRSRKRVFVQWGQFIEDWKSAVGHISRTLDLTLLDADSERVAAVDCLVDPKLRRNTVEFTSANSGAPIARAYRALRALTQSPYDDQSIAALDQITKDLDFANAYLGPVTKDLRLRLARCETEKKDYLACRKRLTEERARTARRDAEIKKLADQLKNVSQNHRTVPESNPQQRRLLADMSRRILDQSLSNEKISSRLKAAGETIIHLQNQNISLKSQLSHATQVISRMELQQNTDRTIASEKR